MWTFYEELGWMALSPVLTSGKSASSKHTIFLGAGILVLYERIKELMLRLNELLLDHNYYLNLK